MEASPSPVLKEESDVDSGPAPLPRSGGSKLSTKALKVDATQLAARYLGRHIPYSLAGTGQQARGTRGLPVVARVLVTWALAVCV